MQSGIYFSLLIPDTLTLVGLKEVGVVDLDRYPTPSDPSLGLTELQANKLLKQFGPNRIVSEARSTKFLRFLTPLKDPMVILLIIATPIYALVGDTTDALTTLIAIVPIVPIGWFLESRAQRSLDKLRDLSAPQVVVWRDGQNQLINSELLVPGDYFWLLEGDVVPADSTLIESTQLSVNEAALTGESLPIEKTLVAQDSELNRAWTGTTVTTGRALVRADQTGSNTRFGNIGSLLADTETPKTPLQLAMSKLVVKIALIAVFFTLVVITIEVVRGHGLGPALIAGISLMIAAIPEEFSVVYALYLSIGAWRLAQDKALVRNLPGAEALGSVTVICTDKTGTLTEGHLVVAGTSCTVDPQTLFTTAVLASEPQAFDQLDIAILTHANSLGLNAASIHSAELVTDWPFTSDGNYVSHVWKKEDGNFVIAAKGSFEGIMSRSSASIEECEKFTHDHDSFANKGMRVIAVAGGNLKVSSGDREQDEQGLQLLGLIAFQDPVRAEIPQAISEAKRAGIRTIMITGDHPDTARAIAIAMGQTPHAGTNLTVVTGKELEDSSPETRSELLQSTDVFARVTPTQKFELVSELRAAGEVVAMTGDGINDAPALRAADIGISMGIRGTSVAREASTIVLLDDNFATIVTATRNGRRIYDNLTKAFGYLIAVHIPIIVAAVVFPLVDEPLLLLPIHLVLLEVVLHPIVSLVFQAEPAAENIMDRQPRPANYALTMQALKTPIISGISIAIFVVSTYQWALHAQWDLEEARGLSFITFLATQPFLMMSLQSASTVFWNLRKRWTRQLSGAVTGVLALIALIQFVPPIASLFKLEATSFAGLGIAFSCAFAAVAIPELHKLRK